MLEEREEIRSGSWLGTTGTEGSACAFDMQATPPPKPCLPQVVLGMNGQ